MLKLPNQRPCENCGGDNFIDDVPRTLISPIISKEPTGHVDQVPVRMFVCNDCALIRMFLHDTSSPS